ncbi:hypothetical protein DFH06DRAFT_1207677 [Mycena polygramma]|nr:hypothetical protein DFH06DRAFT_1207677 [Mycena polygramma]
MMLQVVGEALEGALKALEAHDEVMDHFGVQRATTMHLIGSPTTADMISARVMDGGEALLGKAVVHGLTECPVGEVARATPVLGGVGAGSLDASLDVVDDSVLSVVIVVERAAVDTRLNVHALDVVGVSLVRASVSGGGRVHLHIAIAVVGLVVRVAGRDEVGHTSGAVGVVAGDTSSDRKVGKATLSSLDSGRGGGMVGHRCLCSSIMLGAANRCLASP